MHEFPRHFRFSIWLINCLVKERLQEEIEGNLIEYFELQHLTNSRFANLKYWVHVLSYLHPEFLKLTSPKVSIMFAFNPKLALRTFSKDRLTTSINLIGFVIGLVAFFFLYSYTQQELSYDSFHENKENIYRIYRTGLNEITDSYHIAHLSGPYAAALVTDYPNRVKETLRVTADGGLVAYKDKSFIEKDFAFADPNFFQFFTFPLLKGDVKTVLHDAESLVLSQSTAKKYFGSEDPIGKTLNVDKQYSFTVTGVMEDFPDNSHIHFDMVASLMFYEQFDMMENWFPNFLTLYATFSSPDDLAYLNGQFPNFMKKHLASFMKNEKQKNGLAAVPLNEVYFGEVLYEMQQVRHGNSFNVVVLNIIGLLILVIACFNYVNLTVARSLERGKEVAVRKAIGAHKTRLVLQLLGETALMLLLAFVMAIVLTSIAQPLMSDWFGVQFGFAWKSPQLWAALGALYGSMWLFTGLYPAFALAAFNPLKALKETSSTRNKPLFLRKGLITIQFVGAIFLLSVTAFFYLQIQFVFQQDLGYDPDKILVINVNNNTVRANYDRFRSTLLEDANINNVSAASGEPGGFHDTYTLDFSETASIRTNTVFSDLHYVNLLGLEVVAGRAFDPNRKADEGTMMINEQTAKASGLSEQELLGKKIKIPFREFEREIIGIYKDYNFSDLHFEIAPQAIIFDEEKRQMLVSVNASNYSQTLALIEEKYNTFSAGYPLEIAVLEDRLAIKYIEEERQVKMFGLFTSISVALACMGIFGLISFSARKKQKEISIRKVLGASKYHIFLQLSKEYLILIAVALFLSVPAAWLYLEDWLNSYAYRIEILEHLYLFLVAGALVFLVAAVAITIKAIEAIAVNPAKIMRME